MFTLHYDFLSDGRLLSYRNSKWSVPSKCHHLYVVSLFNIDVPHHFIQRFRRSKNYLHQAGTSNTDTDDEVFEDDESIALTSNQGGQHQAKAIMASKAKGLALYIVVCNHNHYWCKVGRTTQSKKALRSRYYFAYYSWMTYF